MQRGEEDADDGGCDRLRQIAAGVADCLLTYRLVGRQLLARSGGRSVHLPGVDYPIALFTALAR